MGWCSATEIFDRVCESVIEKEADPGATIRSLILVLEEHDWDCQWESEYRDHPMVKPILKELHPRWYEED